MTNYAALVERLKEQAVQQNHRRLLVFSGSAQWARQRAAEQATADSIWLGQHPPEGMVALPVREAHRLLGQTLTSLIYDAWDGFNPNSFGQISGTLSGGGLLILLCPPLSDWPDFDDPEHRTLVVEPYTTQSVGRRFISRVCRLLEDDPYSLIIQEGQPLPDSEVLFSDLNAEAVDAAADAAPPCLTRDQQQAVELIIRQLQRGRRPTVLTAERGRGKSTALGIAAAQLVGFDYQDILLTAPERAAVSPALDMAADLLPGAIQTDEGVQYDDARIRFMLPEQLLEQPGEGQILLVDEAAAIPVPMLVMLLKRFPRIVFASTVHGYEGTGQGFTLRFSRFLNELTPQWKHCHLKTPIRWAEDDPLEQLVFNLLLLNAEPLPKAEISAPPHSGFSVVELDRDQLDEDYSTLQQLFGLLVLAHYRTTPGDLRILLDSPNLHIWLLQSEQRIAGAVLVAEEGPLPEALAEAIWSGERRPRGHLLPQTLVHQEGYRMAAGLTCGRIMRLVVHPALQRQGLGRQLLQAVAGAADNKGWDYLGTSFALTGDLYAFWRACGYEMVRLGNQRDAISGCFAALLLKPLSAAGDACVARVERRFARQFALRLTDDWKHLEVPLLAGILAQVDTPEPLDADDLSDLSGFIRHNRSYESSVYALNRLLRQALHALSTEQQLHLLQDEGVVLLMQRVLQQQSWDCLEQDGQGRRGQVRELRRAAGLLLDLLQVPDQ